MYMNRLFASLERLCVTLEVRMNAKRSNRPLTRYSIDNGIANVTHNIAVIKLNSGATQSSRLVLPLVGVCLLPRQGLQLTSPTSSAYFLKPQMEHSVAPGLPPWYPRGHGTHCASPYKLLYVPTGHGEHDAAPGIEKVPGLQSLQTPILVALVTLL